MKKLLHVLQIAVVCLFSICGEAAAAENWPQWRGPLATGEAPDADPPLEWNENEGTGVRWKTELPGRGHSTPVVWGDRIFLTTAVPFGEKLKPKFSGRPGAHDNLPVTSRHKFVVIAVDRTNGKILWKTVVHERLPHEGAHNSASLASASPITDGQHVFAFFGSYGLYCLDYDGKIVWSKQLGTMHTKHGHGEGASPVLHGNTLVVNWDHEEQSFVIAIDKRTGRELWKINREEVTSWATPIVAEHEGRPQLIVSGTGRVRGYDLATAKVIWECGGLSANIVASPVYADGMVIAGSSYETTNMLAIRLAGAKGDITDTDHVVWSRRRTTPYVPSLLLYGDSVYFLRHYQGILTRVRVKTGIEVIAPSRLGAIRNVYASPVAAAGRIYITDLDGTTMVITHTDVPRVLAVNQLNEGISGSAAIVGKEMFLRGERSLYCLAAE
jgi:outer membrane protein assembly factor BamB